MSDRKPLVVFVAGDGASGRILCEAEQRLRGELRTRVIVQKGGGAEGLCKGEDRPHIAIDKEDIAKVDDGVHDDNGVRPADLVIVAHSGTAYQIEVAANLKAFGYRIPCLRVFDHPLGTRHAYFREVVKQWERQRSATFSVTAITKTHADDLRQLYPSLAGHIEVIGNPLHIKLETLFAEGRDAVRARLRKEHRLPQNKPVAALFLSGNNHEQFTEMLQMADFAMRALADIGGAAVADVHFVNQEWKPEFEEHFTFWREKMRVKIATGVSHDAMLALGDILIAAPTSTTVERALSYGIPVIECGGPATRAELQSKIGRSFPYFTPELEHNAVLWADETYDSRDWDRLFGNALNPRDREMLNAAAKLAGTVPEPGAMDRLLTLIRNRFR